jgi:hypothetical protein
MPTLQEDMDDDRSTVFVETDEFAETVTYTPASTGTGASLTVVRIEGIYAIFDNKVVATFHASAADLAAPEREDRITQGDGQILQVVDIQSVNGMWELRCARMQDRQ